MSAIYLATDPMTAVREYNQDFQFLPVTLAQYRLTDARIAELNAPELLAAYGTDAAIHTVPWRAIALQGKEPLQWPLVDALISDGWHGAEYPSAITPAGRCIVLWSWNQKGAPRLALFGPRRSTARKPDVVAQQRSIAAGASVPPASMREKPTSDFVDQEGNTTGLSNSPPASEPLTHRICADTRSTPTCRSTWSPTISGALLSI